MIGARFHIIYIVFCVIINGPMTADVERIGDLISLMWWLYQESDGIFANELRNEVFELCCETVRDCSCIYKDVTFLYYYMCNS